ncbi:TetR/AcrR family transcriptional regulator [Leptospira gomenensis]|uniref:TetR/AcrR family transcriptional regulator n=1 Tax=Leptospira gomenensis TaxID=2484974 RepID=A0A5F1YK07_9LEPT|nr:TetR/AcrR family transcriptional regulator [Leptospira gomenensis]TGK34867.1 TetR/AcrR family transcriptional regulator [Leptospira gomenensis]TGK41115.1 TetR/AcrR family transcriptional regulator [Leptospira gomenensis]TGK42082.1 TetR/AcrR family transcriptional regulator [Leptospira gomenensis]TGK56344.1 TetR/AcrR family transcriptional regulator [Leptospira gomenensis]
MEEETVLGLRTNPIQKRAREKREIILNSAKKLILKKGPDKFTLQEIAEDIDSPIGTIYRYYSGKPAILRAIAQIHLDLLRSELKVQLTDLGKSGSEEVRFYRIVRKILNLFEKFYEADPAFQTVWSGSQAYPSLRELDLDDTRKNAEIVADALECFVPRMQRTKLATLCVLLCDSIGSALRMTSMMDEKEKKRILSQLRAMITNHLYWARKSFGPR